MQFIAIKNKPSAARSRYYSGFTLFEIMIVVAIIAILSAIAIPSYQDHIRRGQLQENFSLMSSFQLRIEQSYQDNRFYGETSAGSNACSIAVPSSNRFDFSCIASEGGQAYTLTSQGIGGVVLGYAYSVDQSGQRRTLLFKGQDSIATCWLDRGPSC